MVGIQRKDDIIHPLYNVHFKYHVFLIKCCPRMNTAPSVAMNEVNAALKQTPRLLYESGTWVSYDIVEQANRCTVDSYVSACSYLVSSHPGQFVIF